MARGVQLLGMHYGAALPPDAIDTIIAGIQHHLGENLGADRVDTAHVTQIGQQYLLRSAYDTGNTDLAFRILYQFVPQITRALRRRFRDLLSPEAIEDIALDTIVLEVEQQRYDPTRARIETWIVTQARWRAYSLLRKPDQSRSISIHGLEDILPELAQEDTNTSYSPSYLGSVNAELQAAIEQLPRRQAQVIKAMLDGDSYERIADRLHIGKTGVYTILHRARARLRLLLEDQSHEQPTLPGPKIQATNSNTQEVLTGSTHKPERHRAARQTAPNPHNAHLSMHEWAILQLAADGKDAKACAETLVLAEYTIEEYWVRLRKKLGACNKVHAVAIAYELGLIF